jgi:hypothetical protein
MTTFHANYITLGRKVAPAADGCLNGRATCLHPRVAAAALPVADVRTYACDVSLGGHEAELPRVSLMPTRDDIRSVSHLHLRTSTALICR